jgi:hypothetical protein
MVSRTDVANTALSILGDDIINDIEEGTRPARLANGHYEPVLKEVLREHQWNCATKRATLAASTTAPDFEYSAAFPLPSNFLRLVRVNEGTYDEDYRIENHGGVLALLSDESTVRIEYVALIEPNEMDALFLGAFTQRLAAEMAWPLTKNATLSEQAWNLYSQKIRTARTIDSMEGKPRGIDSNTWLDARL